MAADQSETVPCHKHPDVPSTGTIMGKRNQRVAVCQRCASDAATFDQNYSFASHDGGSACSPDASWSGVDQADLSDPEKVWRCDGCGQEGTSAVLTARHLGGSRQEGPSS